MSIPYNELLNNPKYQIVVTGLTGGPVVAINQADLGIAGGNDFSTAGEALRDLPVVGQALAIKDKFSNLVKLTGKSVLTQFETRLAWSNSLKPSFTVEMSFYADTADKSDKPLDQYLRIKSAVLPTRAGKVFVAPLGYKIATVNGIKASALTPTGTIGLKIGTWFLATNLVMTAESFTMSKEVNRLGEPLFITGSITVEPYAAVTYDEFKGYFRNKRTT